MFTKKHYEKIARVLAKERAKIETNPVKYSQWCDSVIALSDMFEEDNPRFDRLRFQYAATDPAV